MYNEVEKNGSAAVIAPISSFNGGEPSSCMQQGEVGIDDFKLPSRASSLSGDVIEKSDPENAVPPPRRSTELGPAVEVPRLKRRGLFGQLTLVAEVENPKTYRRKTKWFITFVVAMAGSTAPMGSAIFFRKFC